MTQDQVEKFITELSSEIQKSFLGLKIIGWESVEYEFEMELSDMSGVSWNEYDKEPLAEGRYITREEWREKRHAIPHYFADDPAMQKRFAKVMQDHMGNWDFTQTKQAQQDIIENAEEYRFYLKRLCRKCIEKGVKPCDECIHTEFDDICKACGKLKKRDRKWAFGDPATECDSCYDSGWIITNIELIYNYLIKRECIDTANDSRFDPKKFEEYRMIRTALLRGDMQIEKLDFIYDRTKATYERRSYANISRNGSATQRYRIKVPVAVATIEIGARKFEWVLYEREFDMINGDRIVQEIFQNLIYPTSKVKNLKYC